MATLKTRSVPGVERALTVLEVLARSKRGLALSDLARNLHLPKSSTHCLLLTLERRGYLRHRSSTRRYLLDLKLFRLANMALAGLELREQSGPFLRLLMEETGLAVHTAILEHDEVLVIDKAEPPGSPRLATWIGKRMAPHCTALGKALMAYLPEGDLCRLMKEHRFPRHNENTVTSTKKLKEELARIRKMGYAVDNQEDEIGFCCVGSTIFDSTAQAVASISISGTVSQIAVQNESALVEKVRRTASAISQKLGALATAAESASADRRSC
jgi:DNA-binding IclR family transcriptional regulator